MSSTQSMTYSARPTRLCPLVTVRVLRDAEDVRRASFTDCSGLIETCTGVQSPSCKEGNRICSKMGALVLLKTCLGLAINPDEIPEELEYEGPETIVRASTVRALGDVQIEKDE